MKVLSFGELAALAQALKKTGKKLVLTTGVFDLLHRAHRDFLTKAASYGDVLFVGVEGDKRVRQLKGSGRPVYAIAKRLTDLREVNLNGYAFELPEEFGDLAVREHLIEIISPEIFAVSSHSPNLEQKQHLVRKYGGTVVVVMEKDDSISTTQILNESAKN